MTFEEVYPEMVMAKKEYEKAVRPMVKKLEKIKKYAWKRYMTDIIKINKKLLP